MKNLLFILVAIFFPALSYAKLQAEKLPELSSLTLRQKIGQLCIVAAISDEKSNQDVLAQWSAWEPRYHLETQYIEFLIAEHGVGGVIFYGKHTLPKKQLALTQHFQSISEIPLLIALDAECGLISRFEKGSVLRFPYNMTLGAIHDIDLTYQTGYEIGQQLKAIGVHMNFAPVVDINSNPKNPIIGMRSFGSDKHLVAQQGIACMQGLQDAGIIACAKHFPGHGDTAVDSHMALPLIPFSKERLETIELFPFKKMIEAGVKSIMLAHLEVPAFECQAGLPSSLSPVIVTDLLQKEMGFNGLIITDALGMKGASNAFMPGQIEVKALQAGADILLCPLDPVKAIDSIEKAVQEGLLSEEEIDQKVQKVLSAKKWALSQSQSNDQDLKKRLHSEFAKDLKKKLYSQAITVVKPEGQEMFESPKEGTIIVVAEENLRPFLESVQGPVSGTYRYLCLKDFNQFILEGQPSEIVIGIQESSFLNEPTAAVLTDMIAKLKAQGIYVTAALFCSPYHIEAVKAADRIIIGFENDPDAQQAMGEVINGVRKAEGVLPIEL